MRNKTHKLTLLTLIALLGSSHLFAQGPPPPPPPPGLPIDGGIASLFLLAIGYGYKKLKH